MSEYVLRLIGISKFFGGVKALQNVHLEVKRGEIHALLGENGAGKSTLMKILSGVYQPDAGEIEIEGNEAHFSSPQEARKAGIGIIFQEFSLVPYLTVAQNIFLGRELKTKIGTLDNKKMCSLAADHLQDLGVQIDPKTVVNQLSIAQQQFIEITKAVTDDLKILILDEPTATLTPNEVKQLFLLMRRLQKRGVSMVFISHHIDDVFEIADRVTCLRDGQYIGTKEVRDVSTDQLIQMMVGRTVSQKFPPKSTYETILQRPLCLEASLSRGKDYQEQKITLHKGEILGLSGLVGSGRTELIRALIGAEKTNDKQVLVDGKEVKINSPYDALHFGIGYVPEDRKTQGVILPFSILDNTVLNTLTKTAKFHGIWVNQKKNKENCEKQRRELSIKTPSVKQKVRNLSGGNQQKVVIAKWLTTDCHILIFDEPTRGIDVGAKAEIYELLRELVKKNVSIILISSELPEIIGLSDRVLVMRSDKIVAELIGDAINSEEIMRYATGGKTNG